MSTPAIIRFRRAGAQVGTWTLFGFLPLALLCAFLTVSTVTPVRHGYVHAIDFHTFWQATKLYLHHKNPYPSVAAVSSWNPRTQLFVYPAPAVAALSPFGLLPYSVAVVLFVPLCALSVAAALWLLDVRDWRCYGAAFASPAVLTGISGGTLSPFLLLGLAVAWRWRDRTSVAGVALAALVLAKLFLWPVGLWFLFTGRRGTVAVAATAGLIATVGAWSWVGFAGLGSYVTVLRRLSTTEGPHGYSPLWLGGPHQTLFVATSLAGAVGVAVVARRLQEARSFSLAVVASLALTPILWLHYLALLCAVMGVTTKRLSRGWLVPIALWVTPQQGSYGAPWRTVVVCVVLLSTALFASRAAIRRRSRSPSTPDPQAPIGDLSVRRAGDALRPGA
jgi:hypothetical protein